MSIEELAAEYQRQADILDAKIEGLRPLLCIYTGEDLYMLRRRIKLYYDMTLECRQISAILGGYYD